MRIGGEIKKTYNNPTEWLQRIGELDYSTVYTPVGNETSDELRKAYCDCASDNII